MALKKVTIVGKVHQAGLDILYGHGGLNITEFTDPAIPVSVDKITDADALLIRTGNLSEADIENAGRLSSGFSPRGWV
jgi:hypothetical protein